MRVLIVGAGGLGSPVALALTSPQAGGVRLPLTGLTIVDPDVVELSNLHRQLLHGERDLGRRKVDSAAERLAGRVGGTVECRRVAARLTDSGADELIRSHDLVVEGSDDLATKFLVNDVALAAGVPAVIGGVVRWSGQIVTVLPRQRGRLGCYRCLFEDPPAPGSAVTCQQAGVLGPACGLVGGFLAAEATRLLVGVPPKYAGAVLTMDLLRWRMRLVPVAARADCRACAAAVSR